MDVESVLAMKAHLLYEDKRARSSRATSRSLSNFDDRQLLALVMKANDQLGARYILRLRHCLFPHRLTIVDAR